MNLLIEPYAEKSFSVLNRESNTTFRSLVRPSDRWIKPTQVTYLCQWRVGQSLSGEADINIGASMLLKLVPWTDTNSGVANVISSRGAKLWHTMRFYSSFMVKFIQSAFRTKVVDQSGNLGKIRYEMGGRVFKFRFGRLWCNPLGLVLYRIKWWLDRLYVNEVVGKG